MLGRWDSVCIRKIETENSDFALLVHHPLLPPQGHYKDHTGGLQNSCHVIGQSSGFAAGRYRQVLPWVLRRVCPNSLHP